MANPLERLKYHVSGAIERGEKAAIVEKRVRFNPFPKLSGKYGAPMGRRSHTLDAELTPAELCASKPQGEYDCGGAYWGDGGQEGPVYAVWRRGHGHDGVEYVRALSAESAKRKALD